MCARESTPGAIWPEQDESGVQGDDRCKRGPHCASAMRNGLYSLRSPSHSVSALPVTIPRARADEHLAGGSRSRVPPDGGAMLTLLRLPY